MRRLQRSNSASVTYGSSWAGSSRTSSRERRAATRRVPAVLLTLSPQCGHSSRIIGSSSCLSTVPDRSVPHVRHQTVQNPLELPAPHRVLQLADGFGLDLADAFPGDLEDAADLFQRVGVAVAQAVSQLDDLPLAVGQ